MTDEFISSVGPPLIVAFVVGTASIFCAAIGIVTTMFFDIRSLKKSVNAAHGAIREMKSLDSKCRQP